MRTMKTVRTSLCLLASSAASAQQYVISTIAGGAPPATTAPGEVYRWTVAGKLTQQAPPSAQIAGFASGSRAELSHMD